MSNTAEALKTSFADAKVMRIAIVDDGYDAPVRTQVDEAAWAAFREALADADDLGAFAGLPPAPAYGDLTTLLAQSYYGAFSGIPGAAEDTAIVEAARTAFKTFLDAKAGKLQELGHIETFAREATGSDAAKLGSDAKPEELADYDLIFLDFYLGDETADGEISSENMEAARAKAKSTIQKTMAAVKAGRTTPLFVLISSRATEKNIPLFRDEAELLRSKFRFIQKDEFRLDRPKTDHVISDLVTQRDAADAIETLLTKWQESIGEATRDMMKSVRRLDVVDYAYLRKFRLAEEKASLLEYLTWLFNSYLGSFLERSLSSMDPKALEPLRGISEDKTTALLRPLGELPRIYNDITITQVQSYDDGIAPMVWTGDLFVKKKFLERPKATRAANEPAKPQAPKADVAAETVETPVEANGQDAAAVAQAAAAQQTNTALAAHANGQAGADSPPPAETVEAVVGPQAAVQEDMAAPEATKNDGPDILAVITPVCDLVPGRYDNNPQAVNASAVLMLGGKLAELGRGKKPSSHFVLLDPNGQRDEEQAIPYQIRWDEKWPHSEPISAFDGVSIKNSDYVRTGRLREMYAAELAGMMTGQLSRVGVPVTPPFTHCLSIRVLVRTNKVSALPLPDTTGMAWELFPERDKEKRHIVITDELVWEVRKAALKAIQDDTLQAHNLLTDHSNLWPLTSSFKVKPNGLTDVGSPAIKVQRLEALPDKLEISSADAHVVIQLAGPLADADES